MANRLVKPLLASYVPAVAAVQGRAAHCVTAPMPAGYVGWSVGAGGGNSNYNAWEPTDSSGTLVQVQTDPQLDKQVLRWDGGQEALRRNGDRVDFGGVGLWSPGNTGIESTKSPLVPHSATSTTCYPEIRAVAASPARVDYTATSGWSTGAHSIRAVPLEGVFEGVLAPSGSATQFGLADSQFNHSYSYMPYSIVVRLDSWEVVERGVSVASGTLPSGSAKVAQLRRSGGHVSYWMDDVLLYESESTSTRTLYGSALLYSLADYVDSPRVFIVLPPLQLTIDVPAPLLLVAETYAAYGKLSLPQWVLEMTMYQPAKPLSLRLDLPPTKLVGGTSHRAFGSFDLPYHGVYGTLSRPERDLNRFIAVMPPLVLSSTMITGQKLSYDHPVPVAKLVGADHVYSFGRLELPGIVHFSAYAPYMPEGEIDGYDMMLAVDGGWLFTATLLLAIDSLDVSSTEATIVISLSLEAMDRLDVGDEVSFGAVVELLAMERVAVNSNAASAHREALQYAVNIATGALSTYQGFDFAGFARTPTDTYAYRSDGLYRVGASTDDGELIRALLDIGATDFDSGTLKRVEQAYVGVRTDGQCYVRVSVDEGRERVYRVRNDGNMRRATLAKGVAGRYWSLQLEVVDASFVEVDAIELLVGGTSRRGFGARN